jgi:hypothetical protein
MEWLHPSHPLYFPPQVCEGSLAAEGSPAAPIGSEGPNTHSRWAALNAFAVEAWLPSFRGHTFHSCAVPLCLAHVAALMHAHYAQRASSSAAPTEDLVPAYNAVLQALASDIDRVLATTFVPSSLGSAAVRQEAAGQADSCRPTAFVRLSTRSPKDAATLLRAASVAMVDDTALWPDTDDVQQQTVAFVAAVVRCMRVASGAEAIATIVSSPRICNDLEQLQAAGAASSSSVGRPATCDGAAVADASTAAPPLVLTSIVLREFVAIRPDHEFRLFVSRRRFQNRTPVPLWDTEGAAASPWVVTAISQYFHFLHFGATPRDNVTQLDEEALQRLTAAMVNFVAGPLQSPLTTALAGVADECILDVALVAVDPTTPRVATPGSEPAAPGGDADDGRTVELAGTLYRLWVVELNPFAPCVTGCGLFNWRTDLDLLWGRPIASTEPDSGLGAASKRTALPAAPPLRLRREPRGSFDNVALLPAGYQHVIDAAVNARHLRTNTL